MNLLTLSRAARLAGVTRAELQQRIRRGDIETFEGAVAVHDLLRLYPEVSLSNDEAFERVARIRAAAVPESNLSDAVLPSPQVMVSRLMSLSAALSERMGALGAAEDLLDRVGERLAALAEAVPATVPTRLRETADWFAQARRGLSTLSAPGPKAKLFAKEAYLRIMAAHVKLIPSGHEFFVEGAESILDAAVRAGLKLSYGCSSGNCGSCKVRVASGEIWKLREYDYVLSERERNLGYVLACCHTAVTDVVLEADEARSARDLPYQEIRATLRRLERIGPELVSLNIQTPRTQTLRFMAGQRVRLTLENGASQVLPIASCPCNGRQLWFFVRAGATPFPSAVFAGLQAGQAVKVEGPEGDFALREDAPEPTVFVAAGDGIAPIKSLIEHSVSIDLIESFDLYWATDYPEGHHQGHWGRALSETLDNFRYTPISNRDPDQLVGSIRSAHPDLGGLRFYLAGPRASLDPIAATLRVLGVAPDRLAIEYTET